ncbi:MAG: hypothetical protein WC714_01970 [Candidatus Obscuribacterales bacterium]|jgi:hypothetical protein
MPSSPPPPLTTKVDSATKRAIGSEQGLGAGSNLAGSDRPGSKLSVIGKSKVFQAAALVVLANLLLVVTNPFKGVDPDSLPTMKSWVFWTTQDYKQEVNPKVVLLGSSLLMNSVWMQEAEHLQKNVDIVVNRRTKYLESVISKYMKGYEGTCFNFGLPGSMVSDDYMIARTLFDKDHTPKVMVLCLGPRDLMDTSFSCAGATTAFKYLERFTDTKDLLDIAYTSAWPKINFMLREYIYFVDKKYHSQSVLGEQAKTTLNPVFQKVAAPSAFNIKTDFDKQFAFYRSEVEKGVFIAKPNAQTDSFYDNGKDWKKRFKNSNDEMFDNQKIWLNKCLTEAKAKGITPVIVNMPVSELGIKFIPPQVYKRHVDTLIEMSSKYDCLYVDTMKEGQFDMKDFSDYGHMDASGGRKIVDIVGRSLANDPRTKAALQSSQVQAEGGGN